MFRIPRFVRIEYAGIWRLLRPSQLTHAALDGGQVPWATLGRSTPAPWAVDPPAPDAPSWPWSSFEQPTAFAAETWPHSVWHCALDRLDLRPEVYRHRTAVFNVVWAKAFAQQARLPLQREVPTAAWWPEGHDAVEIDLARVATVVIDRPLIFADLGPIPPGRILIDGNHRATKAMQAQQPVDFVTLPPTLAWRALQPCELRTRLQRLRA